MTIPSERVLLYPSRRGRQIGGGVIIDRRIFSAPGAVALMGSVTQAQTLPTHRIPAALAVEAASETVAACAKQGYHETAQVADAAGGVIATIRADMPGGTPP